MSCNLSKLYSEFKPLVYLSVFFKNVGKSHKLVVSNEIVSANSIKIGQFQRQFLSTRKIVLGITR